MRNNILYITLMILAMALTACAPVEDDIFTTARITVAAGESAPALSIPQGITIENAGGAVPVIADGEASAAATTLVWFSETAPGIFTAKNETVKAVV